jgi:hypothetical protein
MIWKFLDQCTDNKKNVIYRRWVCVYCTAYCVVELRKDIVPDRCIDTSRRQHSIVTCEGQRYDKEKKK